MREEQAEEGGGRRHNIRMLCLHWPPKKHTVMPPGFITTIAPPYPPHTVQGAKGAVPLPEKLAADIELEFGVKFGKAHTERGPVLGRKDREEAVNRADVSTREGVRVYQE